MLNAPFQNKLPVKAFFTRVCNRIESEKMAVLIQQVVGSRYGDFFYPAISGVAQSKSYYPFSKMKPEDGIVNMALGNTINIPVTWADICGVSAIVETAHPLINAEPSQGSHFFHNIAALGITYLNVNDSHIDQMDFEHLGSFHKARETNYVVHAVAPRALILKADGSRGIGVIVETSHQIYFFFSRGGLLAAGGASACYSGTGISLDRVATSGLA